MKLNKYLKYLMLFSLIALASACTSQKNKSSEQTSIETSKNSKAISTNIPTKKETTNIPTKEETTNIPTKEETTNIPTKKETTNIPTKKETTNIPTKEEITKLQLQKLQKNNVIYFNFNKYNINDNYARILDHHVLFLHDNPSYKVKIEGHADERGTPEYNIALGERRANAVKMYLRSKGVPSEQISIISYGKEKPAVSGHDEKSYSKNRRAVLVY